MIDSEPFEVVHKSDEKQTRNTSTEETPRLLIRLPEMDEDGIQKRPTENIPFVDSKGEMEPVYDQSLEEARQSEQIKFENEIAEEEKTTTIEAPTTQIFTGNSVWKLQSNL